MLGLRRGFIIIIVFAIVSIVGVYRYNYFGSQTVMQTSFGPDCRQGGNVLDCVGRKARFLVLFTCEKVVVHDMTGQRQDDDNYQFNIDVDEQYKRAHTRV